MIKDVVIATAHELYSMLFAAGIWLFGERKSFTYYGLNPSCLSGKMTGSAVILLHGDAHNQSGFLQLARRLKDGVHHPVYTLNLCAEKGVEKLKQKIAHIREQHAHMGVHHLDLHLVGHSSGAIVAAEYVTSSKQVEGTRVKKLISIAGRLRPKIKKSHEKLSFCYHRLLERVHRVYEKLEKIEGPQVYSIAADNDWLVPHESVKVAPKERHHTVRRRSHLGVLFSSEAHAKVISWLKQ